MMTAEPGKNLGSLNPDLSKDLLDFSISLQQGLSNSEKQLDSKYLDLLVDRFSNHPTIQNLQNKIQYKFKNPILLFEAACHRSFCHEVQFTELKSNERLEFLGDSIVNFVVTELITELYSDAPEGTLSKLRGSIVREEGLVRLAKTIELGNSILLGRGEIKRGGKTNESTISDFFEAMIGAVLKDSDFETTSAVIIKIIEISDKQGYRLLDINNIEIFDYKSKLQEWTLKNFQTLPEYLSQEVSSNHPITFRVRLIVNGDEVGQVESTSKKKAMKILAENFYKELEKNNFNPNGWQP